MKEDHIYYTYGDFRASIQQAQQALQSQQSTVHDVTDMRSRREDETGGRKGHGANQSVYGARRNRNKRRGRRWRGVAGVLLLLAAVMSGLLLAADFMLPDGVAGYVMSAFAPQPEKVWGVCSGAYDTLTEARAASDAVRGGGGAGFVAYDGRYNVLVAAYPTQQEAQTVADKHGYSLYPIRTEGLSEGDFPLAYRQKVKPLIDYHTSLYRKLYDLSAQLAEGGTNVPYCKQRLIAMRDALAAEAEPFRQAAERATDATTCNYLSTVLATLAALDNLQNTEEALFLSDIRWTYIMVLRINRI